MMQSQGDHVEAGAMLRWIDGEASASDRRAVEEHLAACATCAQELGALQEAARTVNGVLTGVLDFEAPAVRNAASVQSKPALVLRPGAPAHARRSAGRGWRIAASVALLLGALTAVPELRALVLEAWRAVTQGKAEEVPAVVAVPAAREPEMRSIVEVTPADSFAVVFETSQAVGRVLVTAHDSATAIILSSDPQAAVMVLPSRVRIANQGSRADYQIIVPPTLDHLVVTVAGRRQPVITGRDVRGGAKVISLQ